VKIDLGTMRLGALLRGPRLAPGPASPLVISLEAGEFLRLESDEDVHVRCRAGKLWITREKDGGDLWLRDGESAVVDPRGLTLIEAVGLTTLSIGRHSA
jgi:hypothetical protein